MKSKTKSLAALNVFATCATLSGTVSAQTVEEYDPHVTASADPGKPAIQLSWQAMSGAAGLTVTRRQNGAEEFESAADLPGSATSWSDSAVVVGQTYEYRVAGGSNGLGYVLAGIEVPMADSPGAIVIVVSAESVAKYGERLPRLEADLEAEGWDVVREEVSESTTPPEVRARLQALRTTLGERLRAAFLLGQVPQPYSGFQNPDGHPEHRGAWPADTYYADLDGTWTDEQDLGGPDTGVLEPPKGRPEKMINLAGDGKLDQDLIPSDLDIAVGRVDARDMPGYAPLAASDLENRYLDNDHAFRTGELTFEHRTSVTDLLHVFNGNPLARMAYRDGAAVFGKEPDQVGAGNAFFNALESPGGYGLSFAISYGHTDGSDAIGLNQPFKNRHAHAFFLGAFGSFFGDWSTTNNLLRDAIFHPGAVLGSNWCNWPDNHYHQLGALWTIGETLRLSFNDALGDQTRSARGKHSGLMGDPTLRLFVTKPPSGLSATSEQGGIRLSWQAAPVSAVRGYHVYRRPTQGGGLAERLTADPLGDTTFLDVQAQPGVDYRYRVVAVELVETGSGTFYSHSPGTLASATSSPGIGGAAGAGGARSATPHGGTPNSAGGMITPNSSPGLKDPTGAPSMSNESCGCRWPGRSSSGLPALILLALVARRTRFRASLVRSVRAAANTGVGLL